MFMVEGCTGRDQSLHADTLQVEVSGEDKNLCDRYGSSCFCAPGNYDPKQRLCAASVEANSYH